VAGARGREVWHGGEPGEEEVEEKVKGTANAIGNRARKEEEKK
jgi:hypothetical protein